MLKAYCKVLSVILLISFTSISQIYLVREGNIYNSWSRIRSADAESWSKMISDDQGSAILNLEFKDNSVYIIGVINTVVYSSSGFLYVSKFTIFGAKEWEFSIKAKISEYIDYLFDSNNNLYLLFRNNKSYLCFVKLSPSGTVLLYKEILKYIDSWQFSLELGQNDSIYIFGKTYYPPQLNILSFSNFGDLLWNISYNVSLQDVYYPFPFHTVKDSKFNFYISLVNNSKYTITKVNSSGALVSQLDYQAPETLMIKNDNLFFVKSYSYYNHSILKINTTGSLIKEVYVSGFTTGDMSFQCINDIFIWDYYSQLKAYDLNLTLKWVFNISEYIPTSHQYYWYRNYIAQDIQNNVYMIQPNDIGDLSILKINGSGYLQSRIIWGGPNDEIVTSLLLDPENNIYFICFYNGYDAWGFPHTYRFLVKNPKDGGVLLLPERIFDARDYFFFSCIGISCIISAIALFSILKSPKKRIK